MPIYEVIHTKRKEIGYTQEQVADYLGVSAPAVNKWEKGNTYPDISLLPALARLLNVDLNTLLCFHEELSEQEIARFNKEIIDTIQKDGFDTGFQMGREKIKEYPTCANFIHSTALLLEGSMIMAGISGKDREPYECYIQTLYERLVKDTEADASIRISAISMLASKYINHEEFDKAQELLDIMPERNLFDKQIMQANLLLKQGNTSKAAELFERKLLVNMNEVQNIVLTLIDIELAEGNQQQAARLAELSHEIVDSFELYEYYSYLAELQVVLAKKDINKSITLLESIFEASLTSWKLNDSSLCRHMQQKTDQKQSGNMHILPALIAEVEEDPKFAFLQSNKEFQHLLTTYRAKC